MAALLGQQLDLAPLKLKLYNLEEGRARGGAQGDKVTAVMNDGWRLLSTTEG